MLFRHTSFSRRRRAFGLDTAFNASTLVSGTPQDDVQQLLSELQNRLRDPTSVIYTGDVTSRLRFEDAAARVLTPDVGPEDPKDQSSGGGSTMTIIVVVACVGGVALVALAAVGVRHRRRVIGTSDHHDFVEALLLFSFVQLSSCLRVST